MLLIGLEPNIEEIDKYPSRNIFDISIATNNNESNYNKNRAEWFFDQQKKLAFYRSKTFGGTCNTSFAKLLFTDEYEKYEDTIYKNWNISQKKIPEQIKHSFCNEIFEYFKKNKKLTIEYPILAINGEGKIYSTYDNLINNHKNKTNLKILQNKKIKKLIYSDNKTKVTGIILEDTDNFTETKLNPITNEKVILSSGPFGNHQILERSKANNKIMTAYNLRDHVCISLSFDIKNDNGKDIIDRKLIEKVKTRNINNINLLFNEIPENQSNITENYAFYNTKETVEDNILFIFANTSIAATTFKNPNINFKKNHVSVFIAYIGKDSPNAKYSTDGTKYNISSNWMEDQTIIDPLWEATKFIRKEINEIYPLSIEYDLDKRRNEILFKSSFPNYCGVLNSSQGTCSDLINQENLKVNDKDNLFICDSSTFPKLTKFRPLANTLGLCEKFIQSTYIAKSNRQSEKIKL